MKRYWILAASLALGACADDATGPGRSLPTPAASVVATPTLYSLGNHTCALRTDNTAFCWGKNSSGQLGLRTNTSNELTPMDVKEPAGVSFVAMGGGTNHTCALTAGGLGYCWGDNFAGQLGNTGTTSKNLPRPVAMPVGVTFSQISNGGGNFTCALQTTGAAWCWGTNSSGQLGIGNYNQKTSPRAVVMPGVNFTAISTGFSHTCAVGTDGKGYCWGANETGRLGVGSVTTTRTKPRAVVMPVGVQFGQIAAGRDHSCALSTGGIAYCWGANVYGQLGTNNTGGDPRYTPKLVKMPLGVTFSAISAGDYHNCALGSDGKVYCWGYNISGQIGDGTIGGGNERYKPTAINAPGGVSFASVSVKYLHSCAMSTTNQAYCWGVNTNGELGVGDQFNKPSPTAVTNGSF